MNARKLAAKRGVQGGDGDLSGVHVHFKRPMDSAYGTTIDNGQTEFAGETGIDATLRRSRVQECGTEDVWKSGKVRLTDAVCRIKADSDAQGGSEAYEVIRTLESKRYCGQLGYSV